MRSQNFLSELRESRLLATDKLEQALRLGTATQDPRALPEALVSAGLLTTYQARLVATGRGAELTVGQYQVLDELGRGGFGCVYKARHTLMDRLVALKVISPERVEDARARDWFLREVRATTRLSHPNIVLAYDAAEVDGRLFLAMEYIEGPNLHHLVQRQGPLPLGLAWQMLQQAASALRYAHEQHLIHRDIKPANLLIPQQAYPAGRAGPETRPVMVKVVDFGLARLQAQGTGTSLGAGQDGGFVGTPDYVSPEQARNLSHVDIRADLYSLGCTFYFALTGRRPFNGSSPVEVILQHVEKQATPVEQLRPEVPAALGGVLRRLMEKKPENRFQSPAALLAELNFLCPADDAVRPAAAHANRLAAPAVLPLSPKYLDDLAAPVPAEPAPTGATSLSDYAAAAAMPATLYVSGSTGMDAPTLDVPGPSHAPPLTPVRAPEALRSEAARGPDTLGAGDTRDDVAWKPGAAAPDQRELCRLWRIWYDTVEAVCRREAPAVSASEYRTTYSNLLRLLRAGADTADGERRTRYEHLVALMEPWLALTALTAADAPALVSLLTRCRQFGKPLSLPCGRQPWSRAILVALALFLLPVGFALYQAKGLPTLPRQFSAPDLWRFVQTNPVLSLAAVLPCVVLAGFTALTRQARR